MSELRPRLEGLPTSPPLRLVHADNADGVLRANPPSGLLWARRYRHRLITTDVAVVLLALAAATAVRFVTEAAAGARHGAVLPYLAVPTLMAALWLGALTMLRTRDADVIGAGAAEYRRVLNATALAFGLTAIAFLISSVDFARGYFLVALPLGAVGLLSSRWVWRRWLLHQRADGRYRHRALVVGERDDVEYVIRQIESRAAAAAYTVVGASVADDDRAPFTTAHGLVPVVSNLEDAATAAARLHADSVIVAGQPDRSGTFIRSLSWSLEGTAAELVLSSRLTDVAGPRIHFRPVEGLPLIHVEIPRFEGSRHIVKRLFDIVFAGTALLLAAPLFVGIAIWIKLDSPGPVLFRQERCGRNGESFEMIKFRSMVQTAEGDLAGLLDLNEGSGVLFKLRNDPRVTRAGAWLRKYSLDELPQFWNILFGDMSVVGPRPPLPREVDGYEHDVHRRLYTKPGLTGLWQISGRSDLSWEESVRLDLYYVENWSLTGDLMIVWRTVKTVLRPVGSY